MSEDRLTNCDKEVNITHYTTAQLSLVNIEIFDICFVTNLCRMDDECSIGCFM